MSIFYYRNFPDLFFLLKRDVFSASLDIWWTNFPWTNFPSGRFFTVAVFSLDVFTDTYILFVRV